MKWLSSAAVLWVMDEAPAVPPHLFAALAAVARYADEDGRGAYPARSTVAAIIRKSEGNTRKDLAALRKLGLLLPGDQRLVKDMRPDRRPFVYDLPMSRGVAHDPSHGGSHRTPRSGNGGSHRVITGGRTRSSGGSHTTPEEVLKTSGTGAAPGDDAAAPCEHGEPRGPRYCAFCRKAETDEEGTS